MSRYIDADMLISTLKENSHTESFNGEYEDSLVIDLETAIQTVYSQPTVEVSKWIPCSERNPDVEQEVEVTVKRIVFDGIESHEHYFTCYAFFEDGEQYKSDSPYEFKEIDDKYYDYNKEDYRIPKGWYESTTFTDSRQIDDDCEVTAWKPTPGPCNEKINE